MSKEAYISQEFPVQCFGRDSSGKKVLDKPVNVTVRIHQSPGDETNISMMPMDCPHNAGGHGQRCEAASKGTPAFCVYSADIPYALESFNKKTAKG